MRKNKRYTSTESQVHKQEVRKQLQKDTENFLAKGGKVLEVPYGLSRKHLGPKK